ncbi:MAG: hypothetical protein A2W91_18425 [Bacteroidetes bacterium GWF2_38_335]|nr:MAG: hypothetical protein A2W91_18425 [Bacteroidetes bacterium GWF2_38_335]HBS88617.1 hypothetical protein [Bacteroidales bacterium]
MITKGAEHIAVRFILQQNDYQVITKGSLTAFGMTARIMCWVGRLRKASLPQPPHPYSKMTIVIPNHPKVVRDLFVITDI